MRLSEAILLGIGAVKNSDTFFSHHPTPRGCALCTGLFAVGSALLRKGSNSVYLSNTVFPEVYKYWPWTQQECRRNYHRGSVAEVISACHFTGESRESIAAWIATIEPQDTPEISPATQQVAAEMQVV